MGRAVILAVILNEQRNTASGIADAPRDGSGVAQFAQKAMSNEEPAHTGTIRDHVDSRGYARDDMGIGNPGLLG